MTRPSRLTDTADRPPARLTRESRRRLTRASSAEVYTDWADIYGMVHEIDQNTRTFQLTLPDGSLLKKVPIAGQHRETVLEAVAGYNSKVRVQVSGVGRYDRGGRLLAIAEVDHLTILDPLDVRVRLDEFARLRPGWLDGKGLAPPDYGLEWLAGAFDMYYPDDAPLPYLFPTPEGGVRAEWSLPPLSPSLDIDLATRQGRATALRTRDGVGC